MYGKEESGEGKVKPSVPGADSCTEGSGSETQSNGSGPEAEPANNGQTKGERREKKRQAKQPDFRSERRLRKHIAERNAETLVLK